MKLTIKNYFIGYSEDGLAQLVSLKDNTCNIYMPLLPENVTTGNKDYAEALMSMSDKEYGVPGEYWVFTSYPKSFTPGKLYRASKPVNQARAFIDDEGDANGYYYNNPLGHMRKATFQEIQAHFEALPEHWAFEVTKENYKEFKHLRELTINANTSGYITSRHFGHANWGYYYFPNSLPTHYTIIPFELFKKHFMPCKPVNTPTEKKITGYKLIKEEYIDAVGKIIHVGTMSDRFKGEKIISSQSIAKELLEKAGVLDLWFEPVYEPQEQVVDMGGWKIKVKDNKAFYGTEDITWYVKGIIGTFNGSDSMRLHNDITSVSRDLHVELSTLSFTKTGCVSLPSKYSDWKKVYDMINK